MSGRHTLRKANRRKATPATWRRLPLAALLAAAPAAYGAGLVIEPSVAVTETLTDNYALSAAKKADSITQASAGLRAASTAGRLRGFLDYSLTGLVYASHSERNDILNALRAAGTAEVIERRGFVDVQASISQQTISAFGTQSPDPGRIDANRAEVRSLAVTPYLRGRLAGDTDYELRVSHDLSKSDRAAASDVSHTSALAALNGGRSVVGWGLDASRQITDFETGRRTEDDRLRGSLRYAVRHGLVFGVNAGRESNDYTSVDKRSSTTWGANATWTPSPRTSLAASFEHRFFGKAHSLVFSHRSRRTVWSFADTRDVSVGNNAFSARRGSIYDLFFLQFASVEPDPVRRDALVREFLRTNGIDADLPVISDFLQSSATLQRLQSLSFALLGVRSTVTFRATQSRSERLDIVSGAIDDLSQATQVRQRGFTADLSHRLTPLSTVGLGASWQRTRGSLGTQSSSLKGVNAGWSTRTGPRSNLSAGVRHVEFDATANPYNENAVFATFQLRF